jgi:hypothetical protein
MSGLIVPRFQASRVSLALAWFTSSMMPMRSWRVAEANHDLITIPLEQFDELEVTVTETNIGWLESAG